MAEAQITHRWSWLKPAEVPEGGSIDEAGMFSRGNFPSTAERMRCLSVPVRIQNARQGVGYYVLDAFRPGFGLRPIEGCC